MTGLAKTIRVKDEFLVVSAHHQAWLNDLSLCDNAARVHGYFRLMHEINYRWGISKKKSKNWAWPRSIK